MYKTSQNECKIFWITSITLTSILAIIAFFPTFSNGLVYDDHEVWGSHKANEMEFVREGFSAQGVKNSFTSNHGNIWQPITWISHMIDSSLFGSDNVRAGHGVNLFIHLLNALLICFLYTRWFKRAWVPLLFSLLWAVHPLRVESVVWLIERKDVLSTFFALCTFVCFHFYMIGKKRHVIYPVMILCYLLALGAKASTLSLLVILPMLDFFIYSGKYEGLTRKIRLGYIVSFVFISLAYLVYNLGNTVMLEIPLVSRIQNSLNSLSVYFHKTMIPVDLCYFYPFNSTVPVGKWLVVLVVCIVIVMSCWIWRKKYPFLSLGILWYFAAIFPALGIIQVGEQGHADRYTYIPSIGIGFILYQIYTKLNNHVVFHSVLIACVLAFTFMSNQQSKTWKNNLTLYSHALKVDPQNYHAQYNLALEIMEHEPEKALILIHQARTHPTRYKSASLTLAKIHKSNENHAEAAKIWNQLLHKHPYSTEALAGLAWHYDSMGDLQQAETLFKEAVAVKETLQEKSKLIEYAAFLYKHKRYADALVVAKKAQNLNPVSHQIRAFVEQLKELNK